MRNRFRIATKRNLRGMAFRDSNMYYVEESETCPCRLMAENDKSWSQADGSCLRKTTHGAGGPVFLSSAANFCG